MSVLNMCMIEDDKGHVLVQNKVNDSYTGITYFSWWSCIEKKKYSKMP